MFVSLGAKPRAQQVIRVRGPKVFPPKPAKMPKLDDSDSDEDLVELGDPQRSWTSLMEADARLGPGDAGNRQQRLDNLYRQLYQGAERELVPLFSLDKPEAHVGRGESIQYHHVTAGGALAHQKPAGTCTSRALRLLQHRIEDVAHVIQKFGSVPQGRHHSIWQPISDLMAGRGRMRRLAGCLPDGLAVEVSSYLIAIFSQAGRHQAVLLRSLAA
eukprot:2803300-Pyramimonas_sp.AAC.1